MTNHSFSNFRIIHERYQLFSAMKYKKKKEKKKLIEVNLRINYERTRRDINDVRIIQCHEQTKRWNENETYKREI